MPTREDVSVERGCACPSKALEQEQRPGEGAPLDPLGPLPSDHEDVGGWGDGVALSGSPGAPLHVRGRGTVVDEEVGPVVFPEGDLGVSFTKPALPHLGSL